MKSNIKRPLSMDKSQSAAQIPVSSIDKGSQEKPPRVLTPGQWARDVLGVEAPFGFDRMPTVFG